MVTVSRLLAAVLAALSVCASAQDAPNAGGHPQEEFVPQSGQGRVVLVISGQTGMSGYRATAQQVADAGFDVVLVDGNDFWIKDTRKAWTDLRAIITRAQAGPHALPGKVGVIGYSLGGGSALAYTARMPDLVAAVVAGYPLTAYIQDPADFVSKLKVPVQIYAGTADIYKNCCLIEKARALAEAAKATTPPILTLHEYNGVGHGFNLPTAPRKDLAAGEDAMQRTLAEMKRALGEAGQ